LVSVSVKFAVPMADARRGRCGTEAGMRAESTAKTVAGVMALVGMLALSSPGVRVARAGDGDAASSEVSSAASSGDAGVCRVGEEPKPWVSRAAISAHIAERLKAEMQNSDEKPIPLNGRGYNYRTARDPQQELATIRAEAARQKAQPPASR
jgi:hypothetical protein